MNYDHLLLYRRIPFKQMKLTVKLHEVRLADNINKFIGKDISPRTSSNPYKS